MTNKGGFTLIELLVVVLIIGILAGVALPQYQKAVEKSRVASALAFGRGVMTAQDAYYMANGTYTDDIEALDLGFSNCPKGFNCVFSLMQSGQKMQVNRRNGAYNYAIIFSFSNRTYVDSAGKIYCAALQSSPKDVSFCKTLGTEELKDQSEYARIIIQ